MPVHRIHVRTEERVNYMMILLSVLVCLASQADTVKIVSAVLLFVNEIKITYLQNKYFPFKILLVSESLLTKSRLREMLFELTLKI